MVGVGPAAKLVPYVHEASKAYHAEFQLACESPTGDLEVEPTSHSAHPVPGPDQVSSVVQSFVGALAQTPPISSAIKVAGKRAYDLARSGRSVEIPTRNVQIHSMQVIRFEYPRLELKIVCGTGTYIRTLGMDIARALDTVAVMTKLTRTSVGEFHLSDAATVDQIRKIPLESLLAPAARGVAHLPTVVVTPEECQQLRDGKRLSDRQTRPPKSPTATTQGPAEHVAALTADGYLQAVVIHRAGQWCPKRVFPLR